MTVCVCVPSCAFYRKLRATADLNHFEHKKMSSDMLISAPRRSSIVRQGWYVFICKSSILKQWDSFSWNLGSGVGFFLIAADRKVQRNGGVSLVKKYLTSRGIFGRVFYSAQGSPVVQNRLEPLRIHRSDLCVWMGYHGNLLKGWIIASTEPLKCVHGGQIGCIGW